MLKAINSFQIYQNLVNYWLIYFTLPWMTLYLYYKLVLTSFSPKKNFCSFNNIHSIEENSIAYFFNVVWTLD